MNWSVNFKDIPLTALSEKTIEFLSASLNSKKILSEHEIFRDWRGLTSFLLFSVNDFNVVDQSKNKFKKLLHIWIQSYAKANCSDFLQNLKNIQRFDVHDDIIDMLVRDANNYSKVSVETSDVSVSTETPLLPLELSPHDVDYPTIKSCPENHIITKQDLLNRQQLYDAFVLYDEDDSIHMPNIINIVKRLEKMNFLLCIKERDFLMGVDLQHDAVLNMISNRCQRVVIFISRKFLSSRYNQFLSQFCQRQSIDKGRRKLIPILMEELNLPLSLKYSNSFKFYKINPFMNFYDTLEASMRVHH